MTIPCRSRGYTLIEVLVVVAIVGILSMVGVSMMGDRKGSAVRSILDEVEGVLTQAQRNCMTSSRDVTVLTDGSWNDGSLFLDPRPWNPALPGVRLGAESDRFRAQRTNAGIDTGLGWYAQALGSGAPLHTTPPLNSQAEFTTALATPLFTGAANTVVVNGLTKRFVTGFSVVIVGLENGVPVPDGPIGIIVVTANGSNIYKFYKSDGRQEWRRI